MSVKYIIFSIYTLEGRGIFSRGARAFRRDSGDANFWFIFVCAKMIILNSKLCTIKRAINTSKNCFTGGNNEIVRSDSKKIRNKEFKSTILF